MNRSLTHAEDRIETHRTLMKLLQYVEDECARIGCSAATWMVALSRSTLECELTAPPFLSFDSSGHPRLH